ncbi:outer membrane protein transport protein [Vibrio salilacus]|uniref:outer membrane protein transport protein n=1 Tax=Vibrio salilacus TaxID=1323749 RepID=UPI000C2A5C04|nr:outer membrane protein transport protein [Vibrio salilacus]
MNKTRLFKKTLLAVTITSATLASQHALAAGFQLNSQSATGLGRAFAGDAVIADNASVMSRNAAAMSLFDRTEMSLGFNIIDSDVDVKDVTHVRPVLAGGTKTDVENTQNDATSFVPNLYVLHPVNEKFAVGLGVYSNYATTNEFDGAWGQGTGAILPGPTAIPGADAFGGTTNLSTMNLLLAASYRLNEQWSFGGGLDVIYGQGELKRKTNFQGSPAPEQELLDIDADGFGFGFNLGTVFELNENNRFGLSYHYSPEIKASGTAKKYNSSTRALEDIGKVKIALPSRAEFSGYHRIEDTKFAVHYSIQYISWSDFEELGSTSGTQVKEYKWKDTYHYSIGGTYYIDQNWEARVGYMFDQGVQDNLTSVSVPDSDRQWFSAGATYHLNNDQSIDLGFTYLTSKEKKVNDDLSGVSLEAKTQATAILFGAQYTHKF